MTQDLFASGELELLDIPDAEIYYAPRVELGSEPALILQQLIEQIPWRSEVITLWGKEYRQPRLAAWFAEADAHYTYSGLALQPMPWTHLLSTLRSRIEALSEASFNSVLLNYYRDHRDSMGMHSDDEPELGTNPVIASLSLGERRTFVLKHKFRKELEPVRLELASGSVLLMKGATQHHWKHGINKVGRPCGPRVNLTFRRILRAGSRSGGIVPPRRPLPAR